MWKFMRYCPKGKSDTLLGTITYPRSVCRPELESMIFRLGPVRLVGPMSSRSLGGKSSPRIVLFYLEVKIVGTDTKR